MLPGVAALSNALQSIPPEQVMAISLLTCASCAAACVCRCVLWQPNFDAVVEPLPQCLINSGHTRPIYEPVVYGDHLKRKVTTNFA